jgi:hypothetical protein
MAAPSKRLERRPSAIGLPRYVTCYGLRSLGLGRRCRGVARHGSCGVNGSSTPGTSGLKLTRRLAASGARVANHRIVGRSRVTVTHFNFTFVARR